MEKKSSNALQGGMRLNKPISLCVYFCLLLVPPCVWSLCVLVCPHPALLWTVPVVRGHEDSSRGWRQRLGSVWRGQPSGAVVTRWEWHWSRGHHVWLSKVYAVNVWRLNDRYLVWHQIMTQLQMSAARRSPSWVWAGWSPAPPWRPGAPPAPLETPWLSYITSTRSEAIKIRRIVTTDSLKGHSVYGFSAMNRMRINGQLCDVKLKSGMVVVPAHRLVLASVSPYFHAMFNGKY